MRVLVVDDEEISRKALRLGLSQIPEKDFRLTKLLEASSLSEASKILDQENVDLAFIDVNLTQDKALLGLKVLETVRFKCPSAVCIMLTGTEDPEIVRRCLREGASDYCLKPFNPKTLSLSLLKAMVFQRLLRRDQARRHSVESDPVQKILTQLTTKSPKFQAILEQTKKLRGTNLPVLITGETGSGKEILARYISSLEDDPSRPLVPVHTGAIQESLLPSELFGHVKGSFTGATTDKQGYFAAADGGDIFLDEVEAMPATVQVLLLRTLQDNVVIPVGASKGKRLKFRVISATNQSLEGLIKSGKFREDLYYRLRGVELEIPPLRERREDIPDLMTMMFELHGHPTKKLSPEALRFCESYKWPGNLRQLDKLIETMGEISDGNTVTLSEVENYLVRTPIFHASAPTSESDGYLFSVKSSEVGGNYDALITKLEQSMLRYALDERKSLLSASKLLGVNRLALRRRLKEWAWEEDRDQG